ncbi:MAG: MFS transporter [Candidatus Limnocylindrales bacterium]
MTIHRPARPTRPSLGSLPALSHRNYRLFFGGQLISLIGTWMTTVAQSWLILQLTGNPFDLGLIAVFQFGPVLVLGLFGGLIADSLPKRPTMYVTQTVAMIVSFLLFALAASGTVQVWQVFLLAAVMGVRNAVDMPTRQAFAVEMVGKEDIGNAVALNSAMFNGARVLGPAIAGLTIGAFGVSVAFLIDGFSFLAVLLALFLMRADELRPAPRIDRPTTVREVGHNLADGLRYVRRTGMVLLSVTIIGVVATFGINFNVLIPPLAQNVLHVGASGYGFLMAASGLGSLIAALAIAFGGTKAVRMLWGALLLGLSQVIMGFVGSYEADLILMFAAGAGSITMMATANTTIQLVVPDMLRGRVMSVYLTVFAGTSPIGGLLFGALAANAGAQAAIAIGGGISAIAAVLGFVWLARLQKAASIAAPVAATSESPAAASLLSSGPVGGASTSISAAQATSAEGFVARRP